MMKHIIYKTTNSLNNRFYIGMHSTEDIHDGYLGSGRRIKAEVKKYGKENFVREVLEYLPSREALCEREAELVCEELMQDPLCLNLKNGGEGGWDHIGSEHFSHSRAGKIGGKKLADKLKSSPEFKKAFSKLISDQVRMQYVADRKTGGCFTGEQLSQMSNRAKTPASIEKRKATFAERGHMQGEKNSQFGKCWVTDGKKAVSIKKEQLEEYLAKGYLQGRKTLPR